LSNSSGARYLKPLIVVTAVYVFLLSIKLLGHSFKLFGSGFAEAMVQMTADPIVGLFAGIVATSLVQSSSTTTSIVVGLVAGGALTLPNAVPIIMGANIGTTVTNTLVSFGHVTERVEFRRAFAAGIVHDFFNICAVAILFPLELQFGLIEATATRLEHSFSGAGGMKMFNPLKAIINPAIDVVDGLLGDVAFGGIIMALLALVLMFGALTILVKTIRSMVLDQLEMVIQRYLFRNAFLGLALGFLITAVVQSSSITTSLIIPLAGAGLITVRQIFPYTLGANLGTTMTAMLAAMATQNPVAVTVAFAHLCFNIFGMAILYPLKFIPIGLAQWVAELATRSRRNMITYIAIYLLLYVLPVAYLLAR
jgi:solute carrier family 34 (sodium-dependent phosphate cotransporter)